jgi:short-subunit dehydrogenase
MTQIEGKHVLLTGGSRGIGPVIAEALAARGAHIALAARSQEGLERVAESLGKFKVRIMTAAVDLAQPQERRELVAKVLEKFGAIDILINNAGLETEGAYLDLPWERIRETLEVNLVAPMELTHLLLPPMLARKSGHIVNIASIAGKCGAPYAATYSATKAGMAEWAYGLHWEHVNSGVKFSTIFPGYITEVGMFAKFGVTAPAMQGSCTPAQVADAVVRAIEQDILDVVVNSPPIRYFFALRELSPSLGAWIQRISGGIDFQRRKVGL